MDAKETTIHIHGNNNQIVFHEIPESNKTWVTWIASCFRFVSTAWLNSH